MTVTALAGSGVNTPGVIAGCMARSAAYFSVGLFPKFTRETMEDITRQYDELADRAERRQAGAAERRDVALQNPRL